MQIIAVNASPRKHKNTATILQHVLDGAKAAAPEAQTELLHLYDYSFTGCRSCFQCKRLGGKHYGRCAIKDGITPVLEKLTQADAIVFGTPIYFSEVTGMLRMLEERLLFPWFVYAEGWPSLASKKIRSAFVYTMNLPEAAMKEWGYPERLGKMEATVGGVFGCPPEALYVCDTTQFDDYSKFKCDVFSGEEKARWREAHFPEDCRKAEEMGKRLVGSCRAS